MSAARPSGPATKRESSAGHVAGVAFGLLLVIADGDELFATWTSTIAT